MFSVLHVAARYRSCNEWKLCLFFYLGNWRASLILCAKEIATYLRLLPPNSSSTGTIQFESYSLANNVRNAAYSQHSASDKRRHMYRRSLFVVEATRTLSVICCRGPLSVVSSSLGLGLTPTVPHNCRPSLILLIVQPLSYSRFPTSTRCTFPCFPRFSHSSPWRPSCLPS
jgi:hypothetical protein